MVYAYFLLIFVMANDLFDLAPWAHIHGRFNISDLGLGLIFLGLAYFLLRREDLGRLSNFFTWYVFALLLLVLTQASIASFNYSQSVFDGLVVARHQFYYLAFPLFLFGLDDIEKIKKFMTLLSITAILLIILSVINYFGPTIFYDKWAEGHGKRGGIVRAYIPALEILVIAAVWQFSRYLNENRLVTPSLWLFLIIFGGIIFRQTRGHLIGVCAVLAVMLIATKRFKSLIGLGMILLAIFGIMTFTMEQNLLVNSFQQAYTDLTEEEGTWKARVGQIESSWDVAFDNILTGSGGIVIRGSGGGGRAATYGDLLDVALNTDLGYWVWFKFYGLPGIILILMLVFAFYRRVLTSNLKEEQYQVVQFANHYFTCILISMVTLNYFTYKPGILVLCLVWAVMVNATQSEASQVAPTENTNLGVTQLNCFDVKRRHEFSQSE